MITPTQHAANTASIRNYIDDECLFTNSHFVLKSQKHSAEYICTDPLMIWQVRLQLIANTLIRNLPEEVFRAYGRVDRVIMPAVGGIKIGDAVGNALALQASFEVAAVFADKQADGSFEFERLGFAEALNGRTAIAIEDITSTGGSLLKTIDAARECGADVVAASVIGNRGGVTAETFGIKHLASIVELQGFPMYAAEECPFCMEQRPIVSHPALGHADVFRAQHPDYAGGFIELPTAA